MVISDVVVKEEEEKEDDNKGQGEIVAALQVGRNKNVKEKMVWVGRWREREWGLVWVKPLKKHSK